MATLNPDEVNALLNAISDPWVMHAHRIVIGVVERMPEIGKHLYAGGNMRLARELAAYIERQTSLGRLAVPDAALAAQQFLDLCQTGIVRPRLYAYYDGPPEHAECARVMESAIAMFMARYGV